MLLRSVCAAMIAISLLAACQTASPPDREDWRRSDITAQHPLKDGTKWVAESKGWQDSARNAYREATDYVQAEAQKRPAGSWAVVLDIDETVLSNIDYQAMLERKGASFSYGSWRDWVEERSARPVPDVFAFMHRVQSLGGHVAFVTNRMDYEREATIDNLSSYGFVDGHDYTVLLTRSWPDGSGNKNSRFEQVERQLSASERTAVTTIAYLGDQWTDRPDPMPQTARFFCVPQGDLYGNPCELEGKRQAAH